MIWISVVIILTLIAGFIAALTWANSPSEPAYSKSEANTEFTINGVYVLIGVGWLLSVVFASLLFSMHTVKAGHVGVVYSFGAITDQTGDGIVWTKPWQNVKEANIQVQREKFENMAAASAETQDVFFTVTLNYQVSPDAVQSLYRNVGPNYFGKLVEPRLNQYFKDESINYQATEITTKRDEIREAVTKRLAEDLSAYSINVVALLIDNISYSQGFNDAIEAKEVARQEAIKEQNLVEAAKARAAQAEAAAQGEANATRIRAEGQAQANALLTNSLTPQLIQWESVQKLSDNIQIALVPSGQSIILDPSSIFSGAR